MSRHPEKRNLRLRPVDSERYGHSTSQPPRGETTSTEEGVTIDTPSFLHRFRETQSRDSQRSGQEP